MTTCSIGLAWLSQSGSTESAAHHSEHWIKQGKCWWLICQRINLFQPPWRLRPHVSRWAHDKTDKSRGTSGFHIARIYRPVGRSQGVQSTEESVLIFACLFLFLVDWAASNQSSKPSEQRWEGRKLRLEDEQWLTLCCSLRGEYRWDCLASTCVLTLLLPCHTVQSGEYVTPNSTTLVYVSEERARGTPRLPRISLLGPPPHSFSLSSLKI